MWYQELVFDAGHVLSLGAGALVLACASFMTCESSVVAKALQFIAGGVIGLIVLAAP